MTDRANDGAAGGMDWTKRGPFEFTAPLEGATYGAAVRLAGGGGARALVEAAEQDPEALPGILYDHSGFLFLPGLDEISDEPQLMVRLSRIFGPEVEDNLKTFTAENKTLFNIHDDVPEIILVTNLPPINSQPMALPDPPYTPDGKFPMRFPHRRGWHTDQSFRRPPPDFSLFYAEKPTTPGQGQTLFCNGALAYETLPDDLKRRIEGLEAVHALPGVGRSEQAVRAGETPKPLLPHQMPQRQPIVRIHPVTGRPALYICEAGQLDWVDGPIHDMEPGLDGDGAKLVYEIMTHMTQDRYTYRHEWAKGDFVIWDNRNMLHAPTWYDAENYIRIMWRTTVMGNPGDEYVGEKRSWVL